jgi:hypothetical protein
MARRMVERLRVLVVACGIAAAGVAAAQPTSEQLVYQGRLSQGGVPYSGLVDVRVRLFSAQTGGAATGAPIEVAGVLVDGGRLEVPLAFAPELFAASSLWMQIEVRDGSGVYTTLQPRQPLTSLASARRAARTGSALLAATATHADSADAATTAQSAQTAQNVATAPLADQAVLADQATAANGVAFSGITGNPWTLVAGGVRTDLSLGISKTPSVALDVQGAARLNNGKVLLRTGTDVNHQFGWFGSGSSFAGVSPDGPGLIGYLGGILGTVQGGTQLVLSWNSLGQVGIGGLGTASGLFTVNGSAAITGGGLWGVLSDPATKTDVVPASGTLERLLALRGYEYTYMPRYVETGMALAGRQRGLMADEVSKVFPDWVDRGEDGLMRVTERSTTALLVESLRELREEQDRETRQLLERIEALEAELQAGS